MNSEAVLGSKKKIFIWGFSFFILITLSFGLGLITGIEAEHAPIIIKKCNNE